MNSLASLHSNSSSSSSFLSAHDLHLVVGKIPQMLTAAPKQAVLGTPIQADAVLLVSSEPVLRTLSNASSVLEQESDSSEEFSFNDLMGELSCDRDSRSASWWHYLSPLSQLCGMTNPTTSDAEIHVLTKKITAMIEQGENLHACDPALGRTVLHWTCLAGNEALIRFLCKIGAASDLNCTDYDGNTPLHCLLSNRYLRNMSDILAFLLRAGADIRLLHNGGRDLLYENFLTVEIAQLLAERGLELDYKESGKSLETPLIMACSRGNLPLAKFFLEHGANPHVVGLFGCGLLHIGTLSEEMASLVIHYGTEVDSLDDTGASPLMMACEEGNLPLARLLVKHGASLWRVDDEGLSVLDFAKKSGGAVFRFIQEEMNLVSGVRLANQ